MGTKTEPSLFVVFGVTGDLSRRKLLPALARNEADGHLNERFRVVAVGRPRKEDETFRETARESLADAGFDNAQIQRSASRIHYQGLGEGTTEDYRALGRRLEDLGREHEIPPNHSFYMSLPPRAFEPTVSGLGRAGLNGGPGWTRLVVEKPFGKDLESARELNSRVREYFDESQVYRIDHYLGKDTVQNLLVFRFANAFIESNWNRERIEAGTRAAMFAARRFPATSSPRAWPMIRQQRRLSRSRCLSTRGVGRECRSSYERGSACHGRPRRSPYDFAGLRSASSIEWGAMPTQATC